MTIALGCDHGGFPYKAAVLAFLKSKGHEVIDFGTSSPDSVDYPFFAHEVARSVQSSESDLGIVMCGSGNGVAITANKHQGIRCALCWTPELGSLARQHNNANILSLPVRFVEEKTALEIVDAFLTTTFEGGRHQTRVDKIDC